MIYLLWFIYLFTTSYHHSPTFLFKKKQLVNWDHHPISIFKHTHTHQKKPYLTPTTNSEHIHLTFLVMNPHKSIVCLIGGWATPLKNMSQLGLLFPTEWKTYVPNHQPVFNLQVDLPFRCHQTWLAGKIIELNGGFSSLPCLSTQGSFHH